MKSVPIVLLTSLLGGSALAQVSQPLQPDPAFLQKAITALQTQRNAALDAAVGLEATAAISRDEVARLSVRVKELEAKVKELEDKPPALK